MQIHHKKISCKGIKPQCVEFARSWLRENRGLTYRDVNIAADIWDKVSCYTRITDGKYVGVTNVTNGASQLPAPGDLIIYCEKYLQTGHVAVVADVNQSASSIALLEQNFNQQYQFPAQQRTIDFIYYDESYWLLDAYLLGWKSVPLEN